MINMLFKILLITTLFAVAYCQEQVHMLKTIEKVEQPRYEYRQYAEQFAQLHQTKAAPVQEEQELVYHVAAPAQAQKQEQNYDLHTNQQAQHYNFEEAAVPEYKVPENHEDINLKSLLDYQKYAGLISHEAPAEEKTQIHIEENKQSYHASTQEAVPYHVNALQHIPSKGHEEQLVAVGGREHNIQNNHIDYYAHPKYEYEYKVEDPHTGDNKYQHEIRDGDVVRGVYSFHEADGSIRTVEYNSDKHNGFNAIVKHSAPTHHVHIESHHKN